MPRNDRDYGRRTFLKTGSALAASGLVAGCTGGTGGDGGDGGGGDGGGGDGSGGDGGGGSTPTATPSLEERAQQEGVVREATSITGVKEFYAQFEDDTGVSHERFRSDATKVGTRILQEYQANNLTFDFQRAGDPQPALRLAKEGVYQDVPSVVAEQWPDRVFLDGKAVVDWYGLKLSLLYNTDMISSPPTSLEQMANEFAGKYTVDVRDEFIWVALKNEHGAERAKELVGMLGDGAVWKESHFTAAKNIAAGEVPMGLTYNKFKYYEETGGVLEEQKLSDLPNVVREISSQLLKNAQHQAAATLYMKYSQENVVDFLKNTGRPDAYFQPETVLGNDDYYVWGVENLREIDLEQAVANWEQYSGLSG